MGKRRVRSRGHKAIIRRGYVIVHLPRCPFNNDSKVNVEDCTCLKGSLNAEIPSK